jgi:tape measure domain-containing protein
MGGSGVEIASAYLALRVKMPGVQSDIQNALRGVPTDKMGHDLGQATGRGYSKGFAAVAGAVGGIAAQVAGEAMRAIGSIVGEAREASDATQKFAKTLSFAGIDDSQIKKLAKSTREYADVTVYDLTTIQRATAQLAANGVKDYAALVEAGGNLNAVAGGNAETFKTVSLVLAQSSGAGRLMTQDWNQLANAIPGASGQIQKALLDAGAYTGNFRKALEQGQVTSEEFNAVLMKLGSDPIAVEAAKSTETLEGSLGNLQATIVGILSDILTAAKPVLTGFINGLSTAFGVAVDVFREVSNFIRDNMTWVGPLAVGIATIAAVWVVWNGAIAAWTTITKIAAAAQAVFNAVMAANPIMLIVMAIAAVVAALVYFFTQTELGRKIWAAATEAIAKAATWLWETVLKPTFEAIGNVFRWIWETIIMPIVGLIVNYFRFWGAVAMWLWQNVVSPVFAKIGQIFQWIWATVIQPIIGYINLALRGLGAIFNWLWVNVVKPVWEGISRAIGTAWNWIDRNVFNPFKVGISLLQKAFENTARGIGTAWDGIKRAAAVPINFVLETVWNNGIRSFWNGLVGTLGLKDMALPRANTIRFARGGVLPGYTPGRDVFEFWNPAIGSLALSGGEGILVPQAVRALGGSKGIEAINSQARSGALSGDGIGEWFGDVWEKVRSAASVAWDFLSDPLGAIEKHIIGGIIRPLTSNQNIFGKTVGGVASNFMKLFQSKLAAAAPQVSGGSGMGWEKMWQILKARFPWANLNSAYRPGARTANGGQSYHGLGRAIDTNASMEIFNWLRAAFPNSRELIYSPAGSRQLLNGASHFYSGIVRQMHFNHVHWAMKHGGVLPGLYDEGGWLPHGGMALNLSGSPERVLSPSESADFDGSGKPRVMVVFQNPVSRDPVADAWEAAEIVGKVS